MLVLVTRFCGNLFQGLVPLYVLTLMVLLIPSGSQCFILNAFLGESGVEEGEGINDIKQKQIAHSLELHTFASTLLFA